MRRSLVFFVLFVATATNGRAGRLKRQLHGCIKPQDPPNTKITCSGDSFYVDCYAVCHDGYRFRDNSPSTVEHMCDVFADAWLSGPQVSPCDPICVPPCQNGGTCDAPSHCACPKGFYGNLCQNRENACQFPPSPQNGSIHCQKSGADVDCTVSCYKGFWFQLPPADTYTCSSDGLWTPPIDSIPDCLEDLCAILPQSYSQYNSSCLRVVTDSKSYDDARTSCQNDGAHLFIIRDPLLYRPPLDQALLDAGIALGSTEIWIGVDDLATEGSFLWNDGTPLPATSALWGHNEPNGGESEDCTEFRLQNYKLNDVPCTHSKQFVCQVEF